MEDFAVGGEERVGVGRDRMEEGEDRVSGGQRERGGLRFLIAPVRIKPAVKIDSRFGMYIFAACGWLLLLWGMRDEDSGEEKGDGKEVFIWTKRGTTEITDVMFRSERAG